MIPSKRNIGIGVAVAALTVLAGAGIAGASIPDPSGVIHACYQSPPPAHGANLQVIDTNNGGSCGGGMVPLTWNQPGPQGATGPAGPSTAGAAGLDVGVYSGGASQYGGNVAVCPADHPYAIGGGVDANGASVSQDEPAWYSSNGGLIVGYKGNGQSASPNAWFTATVNNGDNGGIAYVICSQ